MIDILIGILIGFGIVAFAAFILFLIIMSPNKN